MSVQVGEPNVVNKIHSMPWLKSAPKLAENMEQEESLEREESGEDNVSQASSGTKKKTKRNRSAQDGNKKRTGEKMEETTPVPVTNAWGSNANTAQALFPQADDSKVSQKEQEEIDKAIIESVCTLQKEDLHREDVKKNSLENQPQSKEEVEEDDWNKLKHNLPDPPSSLNDNNNNEGKNRNFATDQFGRMDGHNERHMFMGKGGRRKENEFVKTHNQPSRYPSSSQRDQQQQQQQQQQRPDRRIQGQFKNKQDEEQHFRNRGMNQQRQYMNKNQDNRGRDRNPDNGYNSRSNSQYYTNNNRDSRDNVNKPRGQNYYGKEKNLPKIQESQSITEPVPNIEVKENQETLLEPTINNNDVSREEIRSGGGKFEADLSTFKIEQNPMASETSVNRPDIHHSTPNTTSTPEPIRDLESEFHRVNLNSEQQQQQVPQLQPPQYAVSYGNQVMAPVQYVTADMTTAYAAQTAYAPQVAYQNGAQSLPYEFANCYPAAATANQYSANLVNFGMGVVPILTASLETEAHHPQYLTTDQEVARLQNQVFTLQNQLATAQASLWTARLKQHYSQQQQNARTPPQMMAQPQRSAQAQGPPGFQQQKLVGANFELPKTSYPIHHHQPHHSRTSSESSNFGNSHHHYQQQQQSYHQQNGGLRNSSNYNRGNGKVNNHYHNDQNNGGTIMYTNVNSRRY